MITFTTGRNPPSRTEFRVRITDLPRGVDWRDVKDYLRTAGEVTYCNVESDGTAYVAISYCPFLSIDDRGDNCP